MFIKCSDALSVSLKLKKIFGIHGISIVYKVNNNIEDVLNKALEIMDKNLKTFKVVTKRSDKNFPKVYGLFEETWRFNFKKF